MRARVGLGQALHSIYGFLHLTSPPPLQKSSALNFANLPLHAREARGVPVNHWLSVARATESQSQTDLISSLVSIYNAARTHFTVNYETLSTADFSYAQKLLVRGSESGTRSHTEANND